MLGLLKLLGPAVFLLVGLFSALAVAWITGSRGLQLLLHAVLAIPSSFVGYFIHDVMDNTLGMGNFESSLFIIACTTGLISGSVNALWLQRRE